MSCALFQNSLFLSITVTDKQTCWFSIWGVPQTLVALFTASCLDRQLRLFFDQQLLLSGPDLTPWSLICKIA